ncbi:hypothetical protein [Leptolyngbya sp. NIES-2104]|uniref:hypothetical protein n=1 Tax=Leptolyngbya sp. NIES-2104 TaxID=1552121 RepID=UPI0006EC4358|nr:hypothetical protein [Leptolyngbya sp. NIES-2104]GAP94593.1 hypothetical protein NIES2104_11040 [Leptolyngbya sp. NIES-2104]
MTVQDLRKSDMMAHLLDSLESGEDIGHYGRLVFAMVARHFLPKEEVIDYLLKDQDCDEAEAKSLYQQVEGKDYNPPKRDRVLAWQQEQDFPICPNSDDPDACNVYRDLEFPQHVYDQISSYYEHKA